MRASFLFLEATRKALICVWKDPELWFRLSFGILIKSSDLTTSSSLPKRRSPLPLLWPTKDFGLESSMRPLRYSVLSTCKGYLSVGSCSFKGMLKYTTQISMRKRAERPIILFWLWCFLMRSGHHLHSLPARIPSELWDSVWHWEHQSLMLIHNFSTPKKLKIVTWTLCPLKFKLAGQ